jgi:hypothetical protein
MGLFDKIFGKGKKQGTPYIDAGLALIYKLTTSLNLTSWKNGLPSYTPQESTSINNKLSNFQKVANDVAGDEAKFHPDIIPDLQRMLAAEALIELAGDRWKFSEEIPTDWKECGANLWGQTCLLHIGKITCYSHAWQESRG